MQLESLQAGFFFFLNNHITDSESEISPPNVCTEIKGWCNSRTVPGLSQKVVMLAGWHQS